MDNISGNLWEVKPSLPHEIDSIEVNLAVNQIFENYDVYSNSGEQLGLDTLLQQSNVVLLSEDHSKLIHRQNNGEIIDTINSIKGISRILTEDGSTPGSGQLRYVRSKEEIPCEKWHAYQAKLAASLSLRSNLCVLGYTITSYALLDVSSLAGLRLLCEKIITVLGPLSTEESLATEASLKYLKELSELHVKITNNDNVKLSSVRSEVMIKCIEAFYNLVERNEANIASFVTGIYAQERQEDFAKSIIGNMKNSPLKVVGIAGRNHLVKDGEHSEVDKSVDHFYSILGNAGVRCLVLIPKELHEKTTRNIPQAASKPVQEIPIKIGPSTAPQKPVPLEVIKKNFDALVKEMQAFHSQRKVSSHEHVNYLKQLIGIMALIQHHEKNKPKGFFESLFS